MAEWKRPEAKFRFVPRINRFRHLGVLSGPLRSLYSVMISHFSQIYGNGDGDRVVVVAVSEAITSQRSEASSTLGNIKR